ncbi:uncharacterized protein MONOS_18200 [Monocercomonoides exilis]|uniref:uncharacterized protein n=1 Tax=Monocercomonoides exilis TaxID=2049356 RepID=UPI003559E508|nr:hypothetical protein MONOS_18200 [Monocercomonoides exilis]
MISGETTLETLEMEGFRLAEKENASSATTLPGKTNLEKEVMVLHIHTIHLGLMVGQDGMMKEGKYQFNHRSFSSVSSHQPVRALTHEQNTIFFLKNKQLKFDVVELRVTPDPTSPPQSVPDNQPYVCSFCEMRFVLVVSLPTHIHQAYSKMDMTELIKQLFEAEREYLLRGMKKITMLEKLLHIVLHIFSSYELSTLKSTENIHSQQVI